MKKIALFCDTFPPAFAPRMGYLCKYLPELNWQPIIITEYSPQNIYHNLAKDQDVTYINFYWSKEGKRKSIKYAFVFFAELFFNYKKQIILKKSKKKLENYNFEIVLSSTSSRSAFALAASSFAKKHHLPFVMDVRDIVEQFPQQEFMRKAIFKDHFLNKKIADFIAKRFINQRNKVLKKANAVVTVSEWLQEVLLFYNKNTYLIYNGFDSDLFYSQNIINEQFVITYTGRVESEKLKDPSLLFEAIAKLEAKKYLNARDCRLQFYLTDELSKQIIIKKAKEFRISHFIDYFQNIQNQHIPLILQKSSILLLLSNKSDKKNSPRGIMGTKLFEYLSVCKPVLCVQNDESCIEAVIRQANAGISASSVEEVEEIVLEKYQEWKMQGYTSQATDTVFVSQFSRHKQAEEFAEIIMQVLSESQFISPQND